MTLLYDVVCMDNNKIANLISSVKKLKTEIASVKESLGNNHTDYSVEKSFK